jgi:hypothetical protein
MTFTFGNERKFDEIKIGKKWDIIDIIRRIRYVYEHANNIHIPELTMPYIQTQCIIYLSIIISA